MCSVTAVAFAPNLMILGFEHGLNKYTGRRTVGEGQKRLTHEHATDASLLDHADVLDLLNLFLFYIECIIPFLARVCPTKVRKNYSVDCHDRGSQHIQRSDFFVRSYRLGSYALASP